MRDQTELVFHSRFSNVDFKKARRALKHRRYQQDGFWENWGGLGTKAVAIGVIAFLVARLTGGDKGYIIIPMLAWAGVMWVIFSHVKKAQRTVMEAPLRSGVTRIELGPEGYQIRHPGTDAFIRWSHIVGVIASPQGLLILHSDYEWYPIEAAAFRDQEEMEQVAEQIKAWISSSGGAKPDSVEAVFD